MSQGMPNGRGLEFMLSEFLDTEALLKGTRYSEHLREIFNATIDTARSVARRYHCNHYAKGDANEPTLTARN